MTQPIVAITAFNVDRYTNVETFLADYRTLGLDTIELNGRVRRHVIDALWPYIERGEIHISSLHNYCPRPEVLDRGEPELSAPDEAERQLAVEFTRHTIDTARRLGARAVVVHAGEMPPLRPLMTRLKEWYRAGQQPADVGAALKDELRARRERERGPYVEAAVKSLDELAVYLLRNGIDVRLGIENRDYYGQIPQLVEYDAWFERYAGAPIDLWYDFGHGAILERLELGNSGPLLERHGKRLLGLHVHDCLGIGDHIPPGSGDIDFTIIHPYLRPEVLRVLEYGTLGHSLPEMAAGIRHLERVGILSI